MSETDLRPTVQHAQLTREYYERLIGPLREVARSQGYALAVHGSLERDIDLIAAPWNEFASEPVVLAEMIRAKAEEVIGVAWLHPAETGWWFIAGCPGMKHHGRLCWSFHLGGGPYIDLSVLPGGARRPGGGRQYRQESHDPTPPVPSAECTP